MTMLRGTRFLVGQEAAELRTLEARYYLEGQGFELRCLELGAQQQVAGGGAYREGAGFAIGAERLLLALKAQGIQDCW